MALGKVGGNQLETTLNIDSGTLYVDGTNNRVLIGDINPDSSTEKLVVSGNGSNRPVRFMYDGNAGTYFDIDTNAANGSVVLRADARSGAYPPMVFETSATERMRIKSDGTLQLTSGASGNDALEGSITAYNTGQAQVNSRIDFLTDTYANSGQIKLRTNFGASTKDGLIVNEHAYVTMPYQPAFEVRNNGDVNLPNGSESKTTFTTVRNNRGGHYSTSTGRFTAPVNGTYLFTHCGSIYSSSSNPYITAVFKKNGSVCSSYGRGNLPGGGTTYGSAPVTAIVDMNANDYVELWCYSGNTGANFYNGEANFSGCLLG